MSRWSPIRVIDRAASWSTRHPWRAIAGHGALLLVLLLSAGWSVLERAGGLDPRGIELALYDNSLPRVWDPGHPGLADWRTFKDRFGGDEVLIASVRAHRPLDGAALSDLADYADALSVGDPAFDVLWAGSLPYAPRDLDDGLPSNTEMREFLSVASDDPSAHRLLNTYSDGFEASFLVALPEDIVDDASRQALRGIVEGRMQRSGWEIAAMGFPTLVGELRRSIIGAMTINLPVANLIVVLLSFVAFRQPRRTVLALATVLYGEVLAISAFLAAGGSFNYVSCYMAVCVVVVGFAGAMHLFAHYARASAAAPPDEAAAQAAHAIVRPLVVAQGTTAIALLSLATAQHVAIADFGRYTALGVGFVVLSVFSLAPALLSAFDRPTEEAEPVRAPDLTALALFCWRRPPLVLGGMAAFTLVSAWGLGGLALGSTLEESFIASSSTGQAITEVAERYGPISPWEVSVSWPPDHAPSHAVALLDAIRTVEVALLPVQHRGAPLADADVWSLADHARSLCLDRHRTAYCTDGMPGPGAAEALVEEALAADGPRLVAVDELGTHARFTAFFDLPDSIEARQITADLRAAADEASGPATVVVTGLTPLTGELEATVVDALLRSFVLGAIVILGLLAVVLRRASTIGMALVANAAPLLWVAGLGGWAAHATGLHVNSTVMMYLAVVVGIVVDDTVFFLLGREDAKIHGHHGAAAIVDTFQRHGSGIVLTTIGLAACFASLAASDFVNARLMGGLTAATVIAALVADVALLPALAGLVDRADGHGDLEPPRKKRKRRPGKVRRLPRAKPAIR